MVWCFTGLNTFLLQSSLQTIQSDFRSKYGDFAIEKIDVSDTSVGNILDILGAMPFLTERRLVIMHGLVANKLATEHIQKILEGVSEQTDVIFVEPKLDKRSALYKTLKKQTDFKEFLQIDTQSAPQWLVQQATERGGTLSLADARYMVQRMGANQMALSNQLDVLLLYSLNIDRKAIDLLTDKTPQSSIFDVLEAAFGGNTVRAIELYDDQRAQNVDPLAIEALFVWQLHILLLVKAANQAKKPVTQLGISPYVAQKSAQLVTNRSVQQLKEYVQKLTQLELVLKTTAIDADDAMKNFIVLLGQ